jgi:hypothetical protein
MTITEELLVKGYHLLAAVGSKSAPTYSEVDSWLAEVEKHVNVETVRVRVGTPEPQNEERK